MDGRQDRISVEIFGQTYAVRGEGDPEYLMELAQLVDSRMRDVAVQGLTHEPLKIAILAALNIADEYARYRKRHDDTFGQWKDRTEELVELLADSIEEASARTTV
jgi:cell division protein ZapA